MTTDNHDGNEHLFVYGSLLSELAHQMHKPLERYAVMEGWGRVSGKLIDLGSYPGLIVTERSVDRVLGELYRVTKPERLFPLLDHYEGCSDLYPEPHLYVREKVSVSLRNGKKTEAWTYLYNRDTSGYRVIPGGFYPDYLGCDNE